MFRTLLAIATLVSPVALSAGLTDVIIDFGATSGSGTNTFEGTGTINDLINEGSTASGVSATLTYTGTFTVEKDGASAGIPRAAPIWDATLTDDYFRFSDGGTFSLVLSGLTAGQDYAVSVYGGRDGYGNVLRLLDCSVVSGSSTDSDIIQTSRNDIFSSFSTWPLDVAELSFTADASGLATLSFASAVTVAGTAPNGTFASGWWDADYGVGFASCDTQTALNMLQITSVVPEPSQVAAFMGVLVLGVVGVRRRAQFAVRKTVS